MHSEFHLLQDIVIVFALASFVLWLFHRLKVPSIIGFLLTGVLTGPHAFGLVTSITEIEILAEIGVVLLLFTIGIEFSLRNLLQNRKLVFAGGFLQVIMTAGITMAIGLLMGRTVSASVFYGFMVALSSTAVVLKLLQERAEMNKDFGRFSIGVLVFQDLAIVPMLLLVPLIAGQSTNLGADVFVLIVKVAGILIFTFLSSRYLVPWMLHQVARTKSQELFLLTVLMFGLAVAWLTSSLGLSLALGAFLAGLIISESEYSHQAFGNIIPLRDLFISFFFVSIGMLFDTRFVLENPGLIILAVLLVIIGKTIISGGVAFLMGFDFKTTVLAGLTLSQVGEFSFVLVKMGEDYEIIDNRFFQVFITVAVISMALSPFIIRYAPTLAEKLMLLPIPKSIKNRGSREKVEEEERLTNHLLIIGMGLHGHNVAMAARSAGIAYQVLDMDPDIVRRERKNGLPVIFGDATHLEVLKSAGAQDAGVIVITPSGSATVYSVTSLVREMNPGAHIIVRAKQLDDLEELYELGANEVIPEEFETSVEIFSRVLAKFMIPKNEIEQFITELRAGSYESFRKGNMHSPGLRDLHLHFPDLEVSAIKVDGESDVSGMKMNQIQLPRNFGVSVIAISRDGINKISPDPEFVLLPGDIVYLLGKPEQINRAMVLFERQN